VKSNPLQPSRHSIVHSIVRLDDENFLSRPSPVSRSLELLSLHPFGRFSSTSERRPTFDQLWDFFPKHRYGKTAATVWTMWIPVRMHSSIRRVVHSKSRRPDVSPHGPNTRASYMEIACIRSTVRTIDTMVQTRKSLIWKLHAAKVRPSK
jgi:hypothetical protein